MRAMPCIYFDLNARDKMAIKWREINRNREIKEKRITEIHYRIRYRNIKAPGYACPYLYLMFPRYCLIVK